MMFKWILFGALITFMPACEKDKAGMDGDYLQLRVTGEDENVAWKDLEFHHDSARKVRVITAFSYQLRQCLIRLPDVSAPQTIIVNSLDSFYFADGTLFIPDAVTASITITEVSENYIRGSFEANLTDRNTNHQVRVTGNFGDYLRN